MKLDALLLEQALKLPAYFVVHAGQNPVEILDDRHLRTEPPPHRSELEPDHAGADYEKTLRHLRQDQRAGRGDDAFLIDRDAAQSGDIGAGGDHDRLGFKHLRLAVGTFDLDLSGGRNPPPAVIAL